MSVLQAAAVLTTVVLVAMTTAAPSGSISPQELVSTEAPASASPNQAWEYPVVNPCQTPGRIQNRFVYNRDQGKFIQCDEQNRMYLIKCPPGYSYFDPTCEACQEGPSLCPLIAVDYRPVTHQFCGRGSNPCTRDNILNDRLFWDCPDSEKEYLQCNIWGESYIQSCPQNQVWNQTAVTCEYEPLQQDPCHGGLRYYPYAPDPHIYIDCGLDHVATLRHCNLDLVWVQSLNRCDFPTTTSSTTPQAHTIQLSTNYAYPCTRDHINANHLNFPYPQDRHMYIQCDLQGDAYVMTCQSGGFFDQFSHSCISDSVPIG